jgi:hypothetical protein
MRPTRLLSLAIVALFCAAQANTLRAQDRTGWQSLFDGKTLNGWHASVPPARTARGGPPQAPVPGQFGTPEPCPAAAASSSSPGASHWQVVDGSLLPCGEPAGYLTSDRQFKNFVLSIEFKCGEEVNSGVFVRSADDNAGGYEVQIWRQQPAGFNTGAIVGVAKTARTYTFKPNEWNRYQITADGDHLVVELNGETTLDVHDAKFADGHLRLQYQQFPIAFRNIRIRPLP